MESRLVLFPSTAKINGKGNLVIGGCDIVELAAEFGTPLYVYDEHTLRANCAEVRTEFGRRYKNTVVLYACKAFINKALAKLFQEEGMGLEVVSGGEMGIVHAAGFPMDKVYFHGNNKSETELRMALDLGVGHIVVDNFHELDMLDGIAGEKKHRPDILLRISPGVDPNTHKHIITGNIDSKFGFPLVAGRKAITTALSLPNLNLVGLHFHVGSLIFEVEPYQQAIKFFLSLAAEMKRDLGFELKELDIGGGFAVQYTIDSPAPALSFYAEAITSSIIQGCREFELTQPRLIVEPGRSMVARPGVALYTVGAIKDIPDIRRYVAIDGGMGDNIRPALYNARHEAVIANKMREEEAGKVTICGKFCESGDILIRDISLPQILTGDILAVPGCGAYCLPQSSNYNASFKPAVVLVKDGKARLIRRRETLEDLTRCDLM